MTGTPVDSASTAGRPAAIEAATSGEPVSSPVDSAATLGVVTTSAPVVQWQGQITIAPYGMLLDPVPPRKPDPSIGLADVSFDGTLSSNSYAYSSLIAKWSGGGVPDEQQCADWVSTNSTITVDLAPGVVVCVATFGHRTARLTVVSVSSDGTQAVVNAVVWSLNN